MSIFGKQTDTEAGCLQLNRVGLHALSRLCRVGSLMVEAAQLSQRWPAETVVNLSLISAQLKSQQTYRMQALVVLEVDQKRLSSDCIQSIYFMTPISGHGSSPAPTRLPASRRPIYLRRSDS